MYKIYKKSKVTILKLLLLNEKKYLTKTSIQQLNVPREQISFIKGLLIPMYNELARYSPLVNEIYIKPLQDALAKYEELFKNSN